jgi:hypothetical protein
MVFSAVGANGFIRPGVTLSLGTLLSTSETNASSDKIDVSILILVRDISVVRNAVSWVILSFPVFVRLPAPTSAPVDDESPEVSAALNESVFEKYTYTPPSNKKSEKKKRNLLYVLYI